MTFVGEEWHAALTEHALEKRSDLGLGDWYESLPDGLDTAIAPDRLSAGEAQLLALTPGAP